MSYMGCSTTIATESKMAHVAKGSLVSWQEPELTLGNASYQHQSAVMPKQVATNVYNEYLAS